MFDTEKKYEVHAKFSDTMEKDMEAFQIKRERKTRVTGNFQRRWRRKGKLFRAKEEEDRHVESGGMNYEMPNGFSNRNLN